MPGAYDHLKCKIRDIPDFPIQGILFKDITTLLKDGPAFSEVIDALVDRYRDREIDVIVAIESRGYFFAAPGGSPEGGPDSRTQTRQAACRNHQDRI